jgi:WASH complex subunit 7
LNKIVLVFSALCSEIDYLVKEGETKYFISLVYYGEASPASSETGETQKQLGKFLSLFQVNTNN